MPRARAPANRNRRRPGLVSNPGSEEIMQIHAVREAVRVRIGSRFDATEEARLEEAVDALKPISSLIIEFTAVHRSDDAALARLAGALKHLERGEIAIRGLTAHELQLLTRVGVALDGDGVLPR
jgi:anti-anti-sigma regulatory factor